MGHRITWRSRPRSAYPWPLKTIEVDPATFTMGIDYLLGPLTMAAVVELLYRVKSFEVGAYTGTYAGDVDELTLFVRGGDDFGETAEWPLISGGGISVNMIADPAAIAPPVGEEVAPIYKVGGDFYLRAWFVGDMGSTSDVNGLPGGSEITMNLVLKSGTFPITVLEEMGMPGTGMDTTITATEWFPYATTTGDPAWHTTTGAAINGGPGA